jgi:hypothetical protein
MAVTKIAGFDRICARGRCGSSMPSARETGVDAAIVLLVMAGTSAIPATDYRAASNSSELSQSGTEVSRDREIAPASSSPATP